MSFPDRIRALIACALLGLALLAGPGASPALAQATLMDLNEAETLDEIAERVRTGGTAEAAPEPLPRGSGRAHGLLFVAAPEVQDRLGAALYDDYMRTLDHNYALFRWQLISTKISFAVTVFLVLCGVAFSALQFWKSFRAAEAGAPAPTELELSGGKVRVSSPVLGVIVLVISLGFFYLFLVHAYPIEEVRRPAVPSAQAG